MAAIFAFIIALGAAAWWWMHTSVPRLDGRVTLPGLREPVAVQFDTFAVPHVFAGEDADAWRAVGYLQARDRLWQMELYRRAASGRLSELLGDGTIAIDQRFLTLGLRDAAELEWKQTPADVRAAFEGYAAGVNAAMSVPRRQLPPEHQILGLRPEPWTPVDSLAISKLFAWRLGANHTAELLRYALLAELGPRAAELFPPPPQWAPVVVTHDKAQGASRATGGTGGSGLSAVAPPGAKANATRLSTVDFGPSTVDYPPGLEWVSPHSRVMSNAWVVHGSRTASGRPILANDPHLNVEMPSVWWDVHVVSRTLDVAGVTIPGIPFVIIGHNQRIGWGLTNVGTDVQDFFVEKLDPARERYQAGDEWIPLDVRRREIRVRGRREPVVFTVRSTRHGPVLNAGRWYDVQPGEPVDDEALDETVLALTWDVVRQPGSASAFDALGRSTNWQQFVAAVRRFAAPAQNFLYADVDGNIGYAMSGLIPIRRESDGSVPQAGWPSDAGWHGYVDTNDLPAVLNPPLQQVVTSNNEIDRTLPYSITTDWVAPFRAQRILELLGDRRNLDVAAMQQIQADINSRAADWLLKSAPLPAAVSELRDWNRRIDERPASLLFAAFEEALWHRTFADEMPVALYDRFYHYAANERFAGLHAVITDPGSAWFDDRSTRDVKETREDIVRRAADDAFAALRGRFGDPLTWRWDAAHALKFAHPLGGGGLVLDWFFSRGPVPMMGDGMTVNKTTANLRRPYATAEAASYRQILDPGAWDQSIGINTTGQSGHPRSPHYFDQNRLWRQVQYRPLPFTREAVAKATVSRLDLVP